MKKELKIVILAYPDNPVGTRFIQAFLNHGISVEAVIVEDNAGGGTISRLKNKIEVDGLVRTFYRLFQVYCMKILGKNIVGLARKNGIKVYHVKRFNSKICEDQLLSLNVNLLVIASAPILKEYIFSKAKLGCLNSHPGWLPKYRGLGANAYAIQNGDSPGVSIHFIDAGVDLGKLVIREKIAIQKGDTVAKINDRAVARGAELISETVQAIAEERLQLLTVDEPAGKNYRSMSYSEVKNVNKSLRKFGGKDAI